MNEELTWVTDLTEEPEEIKAEIPIDIVESSRNRLMELLSGRTAVFFTVGMNVAHVISPPKNNAELALTVIGLGAGAVSLASHFLGKRASTAEAE